MTSDIYVVVWSLSCLGYGSSNNSHSEFIDLDVAGLGFGARLAAQWARSCYLSRMSKFLYLLVLYITCVQLGFSCIARITLISFCFSNSAPIVLKLLREDHFCHLRLQLYSSLFFNVHLKVLLKAIHCQRDSGQLSSCSLDLIVYHNFRL